MNQTLRSINCINQYSLVTKGFTRVGHNSVETIAVSQKYLNQFNQKNYAMLQFKKEKFTGVLINAIGMRLFYYIFAI